jgi:hypothetical protein
MGNKHLSPKRKEPTEPSAWKKSLLSVKGIILFLIGVPGIYVGILSALPRISVSPQSSLNPSDAFATPFGISNDGYLDLYDVKFACVLIEVDLVSGSKIVTPGPYGDKLGGFTTNSMAADVIEPTRKATITCPSPVPLAITKGDIIVSVSYRPEWLPFRRQKHIRFVTARAADGNLNWFEQPMPK